MHAPVANVSRGSIVVRTHGVSAEIMINSEYYENSNKRKMHYLMMGVASRYYYYYYL